jgi:AraC-like DNA-binding protein
MTDFEFVWVSSGSARWQACRTTADGGEEHLVRDLAPGSLLLSQEGMTERYDWDRTAPSGHSWIHFDLSQPVDPRTRAGWPVTRSMGDHVLLGALCDHVVELASQPGDVARQRTQRVLALLLDVFVADALPDRPPTVASPVNRRVVEFVRDVWRRDGQRIIAVQEVASGVGASGGHVSRQFRLEFGCGLCSALEAVRLVCAAVALQRTSAGLDQVAREAGFSDACHFSRRFSKAYGVPPGRYRSLAPGQDALAPVRRSGLVAVWTALSLDAGGRPGGGAD